MADNPEGPAMASHDRLSRESDGRLSREGRWQTIQGGQMADDLEGAGMADDPGRAYINRLWAQSPCN